MYKCNVKTSKGVQQVEFTPETTLFEFIDLISTNCDILSKNICIRMGFPPKFLQTKDLSISTKAAGIGNRDSIVVEEDPQNSLYAQAGIIEEEQEPEPAPMEVAPQEEAKEEGKEDLAA